MGQQRMRGAGWEAGPLGTAGNQNLSTLALEDRPNGMFGWIMMPFLLFSQYPPSCDFTGCIGTTARYIRIFGDREGKDVRSSIRTEGMPPPSPPPPGPST
jgi:hypothetical protein